MVAVRGSEAERQAEHSSFVSVLLLLETYRSEHSGNRAKERDLIAESQGSAFNRLGLLLCRVYSGRFELVAFDGGLAKFVFLDLAARRHRVLLDEIHVLGDLVVGDVLAAVLLDVLVGQRGIVLLYDGGGYPLAVLLVGDDVDLDVGDLGVSVEKLLDLTRVDVLATANDHVLRPPGYLDVPVLVHSRQVPGVQPALLVYNLFGLVGHLVVALHDVVAAGAEVALLVGPDLFAGVHVHEPDLDVRELASHGRYPALYRVVRAGLGDDGAGLGLTVGDGDLVRPHIVDDLFHHLFGAGAPRHYPGAQAGGVVLLVVLVLELRDEHGRHAEERRAPLLVDGLEHLLGVELLDGHHRPLVGDGVQCPQDAPEAVKERHGDTDPILWPELHALADVESVLDDVRVGQLYPFGEARRPRGVLHVYDLVCA